jgi:LysM repeat protein
VRPVVTPAVPAPLRLTRRGRAVLVVLGLLVVAGGVLGGQAVADGPERAVEVVTHAVQSGETLWQIAAAVAAPGEDVRDVVAELQELNGLADGSLTAGQVLLLPAES